MERDPLASKDPLHHHKGPIPLNSVAIVRLLGSAFSYQLEIVSGDFTYRANFDNNFRSFTDAVSGAMKFFGIKYGLVTMSKDGLVRATQARHDGAAKKDH